MPRYELKYFLKPFFKIAYLSKYVSFVYHFEIVLIDYIAGV